MGRKKVAIVGGGISGLSAAYHLAQAGAFDITLFEAAPFLGGRATTLSEEENGPAADIGPHTFFHPSLSLGLMDFAARTGLPLRKAEVVVTLLKDGEVAWRTGDSFPALDTFLSGFVDAYERGVEPSVREVLQHVPAEAGGSSLLPSVAHAVCAAFLLPPSAPLTKAGFEALPFKAPSTCMAFARGARSLAETLGRHLRDVRLGTRVSHVKSTKVNGEAFDAVLLATPPQVTATYLRDPAPGEGLALISFAHVYVTRVAHSSARASGVEHVARDGPPLLPVVHDAKTHVTSWAPYGSASPFYVSMPRPEGLQQKDAIAAHTWSIPLWTPQGRRAGRFLRGIQGRKQRYYATPAVLYGETCLSASFMAGREAAQALAGAVLGDYSVEGEAEFARCVERGRRVEARTAPCSGVVSPVFPF